MPSLAELKLILGIDGDKAVVSGLNNVQTATGRMASETQSATGRMSSAFDNLNKMMVGLGAGFSMAVVTREILNAGLAVEKYQAMFKAGTGSGQVAAQEMSFIRAEADRLGLNMNSLTESYGKWLGAAKGTAIEGTLAREAFIGVSEGVSAMRLTADESSRAFIQLQQMMSKNKITAEDLNVLAESLPGARQKIADALGKTQGEVAALMDQGKLLATDVLPLLGKRMHEEFGQAAVEAAAGAQGAINRFNNELQRSKEAMAGEFMPAFAKGLTFINNNFSTILSTLTQIIALSGAVAIGKFGPGMATAVYNTATTGASGAALARETAMAEQMVTAQKMAQADEEIRIQSARVASLTTLREGLALEREIMVASHAAALSEEGRARILTQIAGINAQIAITDRGIAAGKTAIVAAEASGIAATTQHAAALGGATVAARALAGAGNLVKGAFTFLGGWPGIIAMVVVEGLMLLVTHWDKVAEAAKRAWAWMKGEQYQSTADKNMLQAGFVKVNDSYMLSSHGQPAADLQGRVQMERDAADRAAYEKFETTHLNNMLAIQRQYNENERKLAGERGKANLEILNGEHAQGLVSLETYYTRKKEIELADADAEIARAKENVQAIQQVMGQLQVKQMNTTAPDEKYQAMGDVEKETQKLIEAQGQLDQAIQKRYTAEIKADNEALVSAQKLRQEQLSTISAQLEAQGQYEAAASIARQAWEESADYQKSVAEAMTGNQNAEAAFWTREEEQQNKIMAARRQDLQAVTDQEQAMLGLNQQYLEALGFCGEEAQTLLWQQQIALDLKKIEDAIATETNPLKRAGLEAQLAAQREINALVAEEKQLQLDIIALKNEQNILTMYLQLAEAANRDGLQYDRDRLQGNILYVAYLQRTLTLQKEIDQARYLGNEEMVRMGAEARNLLDTMYDEAIATGEINDNLARILGIQSTVTDQAGKCADNYGRMGQGTNLAAAGLSSMLDFSRSFNAESFKMLTNVDELAVKLYGIGIAQKGSMSTMWGVNPGTSLWSSAMSAPFTQQSGPFNNVKWSVPTPSSIPGRASGGDAQGLTWVGEQGPELAYFPSPVHIYNAADSYRMSQGADNGALIAAVNELRSEVAAMRSELKGEMQVGTRLHSNGYSTMDKRLAVMADGLKNIETETRLKAAQR